MDWDYSPPANQVEQLSLTGKNKMNHKIGELQHTYFDAKKVEALKDKLRTVVILGIFALLILLSGEPFGNAVFVLNQ